MWPHAERSSMSKLHSATAARWPADEAWRPPWPPHHSAERSSHAAVASSTPASKRHPGRDTCVVDGLDEWRQCCHLTGITSPDNQTRSWLTSQNNQKVVLTGIQYHFGPGAETGPDRPSRALEPSDRHLHTPKQPFHFKYHLFSCRIRPSPAVSGRFRPYSYVFQSIGAVRCRGHG